MKQQRKQVGWVVGGCALVFVVVLAVILGLQQQKLGQEFDHLVSENLDSYTSRQQQKISRSISDVRYMMEGIASMVAATDLSPEGQWLEVYLQRLNAESAAYQIDFVSLAALAEGAGDAGGEKERGFCQALLAGQSIVSDIRYSERAEGHYYFAVAAPLFDKGEVTGALRTKISAAELVSSQPSGLFPQVTTLVVADNGRILYGADGRQLGIGQYLGTSRRLADGECVCVRRLLAGGADGTCQLGRGQDKCFVAVSRLEYNKWHIVNVVAADDVQAHSQTILHSVALTSVALVMVTVLACGGVLYTILRLRRRITREQRRYALLAQFTDTILFEYDTNGDILELTPNAAEHLRLSALSFKHFRTSGQAGEFVHPDDQKRLWEALERPDIREDALYDDEMRLAVGDGGYRWFGCQYKYILGANRRELSIVGKLVDIEDQKSREQWLLEQARRDTLTNVYNKAGEQVIHEQLANGAQGAFFMIDLDNFKEINDTYGHSVGDHLLRQVSVELERVFAGGTIARVGGDEFAIFVADITEQPAAEQKARDILNALRAVAVDEHIAAGVSASVGIALSPQDGQSYQELYQAADQAMYRIKQDEKSGFAFFKP